MNRPTIPPWMTLLALLLVAPPVAAGSEALWELLRGGGQVVIMRHATTTSGVGDPPGFRLDDCSTQRNLSEAGRAEAKRVGAAFRSRGIPVAGWCRLVRRAREIGSNGSRGRHIMAPGASGPAGPWNPKEERDADPHA